jgi:XTP/dITP diphosphohydrolase
MRSIIFASNNKNKLNEIRAVLNESIRIMGLKESGIDIEIPEPHPTLEENAREKSTTIHALTGQDCFSEDTGLEVVALNNEPGVRSARYAGDEGDFKKNTAKLLFQLKNTANRKAQFRTVISLILNGKEYQFEGICKGYIIEEARGEHGFGYDPVFVPEGSTQTFAEMTLEEKNRFSHRKKATEKLVKFLNEYNGQD